MKHTGWRMYLGIFLIVLSAVFYLLHYLFFRDLHHILIYLVGDIAFVFVEVFLVTLVIHGVLEEREKKTRLEKVNMVIGVFFSEVGTRLLEILSAKDSGIENRQPDLFKKMEFREDEYKNIVRHLSGHDYSIDFEKTDWKSLKEFLVNKRDFMLRLLENPILLEHELFTDLLWALFHLTEELEFRKSLDALPDTDYKHLHGDLKRVYGHLAGQWLKHIEHLKIYYPYLFSLALRTNPFNRQATPVVRD